MARPSALALGFLLLLALVAKPLWLGREQWHLGHGSDDGVYFVSAKAIASGQGYRVPSLPGAPYAIKYPPLYPAYLAIAWLIRPNFPAAARVGAVLQAVLLPIFLALLLAVLRRFGFSWRKAFLVAALTVVSMQVALLSIMLFSELLCLCLLLGSILAVERAVASCVDACKREAVWWALSGGLLAALAYLTRNAVLPLLVAAPAYLWIKKKPRYAAYFLLVALPFAAIWHLWTFLHAPSGPDATNGTYLNEYLNVIRLNGFWANFLKRLAEFSGGIAEGIAPGPIGFLGGLPLFRLALAAAAVSGCIRIGRRCHWPLYLIFSFLFCTMMLFWWSNGLMRLTVPAWPALLAGMAEEASHVAALFEKSMARSPWWSRKPALWRALPRWTLIALALGTVCRNDSILQDRIADILSKERHMRVNEDQAAFAWIARHRSPDTVVLAWKDTTSFLYTGVAASRSLFIAVTPLSPQAKTFATSFAALPQVYRRGLLLLLRSDLGDNFKGGLDGFRAAGEPLAGSKLEFSAPGALIYSFPLPR